MVQARKKPLTLVEFLAMPETKPASEFINGRIIQKPVPQGKHSALQQDIANTINASVRKQKIARAFPELSCSFGTSAVVPDITVLLWQYIPRDEDGAIADALKRAPDWTIETLSPKQSSAKVVKKILSCLQHGTRMGWLINPTEKSVFVYRPQKEIIVLDEPDDVLPTPEFMTSFTLTVEELFSFLYD